MKAKKRISLQNLTVHDMAAEGKCVVRHENKVIFVEMAAPGDVVDITITKDKKSFAEGYVTIYHHYSDKRQQPFCEHFGTCGGCKWQHVKYEHQIDYKERQVRDNLERLGKIKLPEISKIIGSETDRFYRNKLEYSATDRKWLTFQQLDSGEEFERSGLGFHIPGKFDKILDIHFCHLQPEPSNEIRLAIKDYCVANKIPFYNNVTKAGLLRGVIIRTSSTGDVMVVIQFFKNEKDIIEPLMEMLKNKFPMITSLQYIHNPKGNDSIYDLEVNCYHGSPYIHEEMEGLKFRISAKSFYQTNSEQAYKLYSVARDFAGITKNDLVYDLYTGTGTIANFVARSAKKVIGLEYEKASIEDAKVNSKINDITNTDFYAGDIKDLLDDDFINNHGKPDIIITDPPRAGMHDDVVKMLLKLETKRIVYISCNPATQARDLSLLDEKYEVKKVQPVDMFPHTAHVENVVLLELR